jgi:hypothetical protein
MEITTHRQQNWSSGTEERPIWTNGFLRIQASGTAVAPTGPWLSAVYHANACEHYYGLMRQSQEQDGRHACVCQAGSDQHRFDSLAAVI